MTTRAEEIAGDGPYKVRPFKHHGDDVQFYAIEGPQFRHDSMDEKAAMREARQLNAAHANGYKQGQQDRWVPIAEGAPSGHVWLTGHAYNDPRTGDYWQKPGYYHEGSLYADDDFDPWDGYPPTHWMPALPSPPNPEQR